MRLNIEDDKGCKYRGLEVGNGGITSSKLGEGSFRHREY